ncbi:hypothetical protein DE146DRAFT_187328 [Phaeosphaeria sp. MPI-PUGE-AT-0046c]|nr:hypothetical protein DE146DRAFT_187328 [Phaeosphaeria sp. MPI-PUGE-AT-0046c]
MAVSFGFSVGDFIAVGKLIAQVVEELRENGEAISSYHSVLIELEALQRALRQLQNLKPARDELLQLTSIRATVCACQKPLHDFLDKISKFDRHLGIFSTNGQRWKTFPRKMQFRVMFNDDIKELRCFLASHIATINMLLMTQAVSSISTTGNERQDIASALETKILANRRLLENISDDVNVSLAQQCRMQNHLHQQQSALEELGNKNDVIHHQLLEQAVAINAIHTATEHTKSQTTSLLGATTQVLDFITSGLVQIQQLSQQLNHMRQICTNFTTEMRAAMLKVLELLSNIHSMLQRIERSLPARPHLPIVQFTTALGETLALPYQLCQQWTTFTELLKVVFRNKPGSNRVLNGLYLIMNARNGRTILQEEWQYAVAQEDHLTMSIVLDDLVTKADICPFPRCQSSIKDAQAENGGRICANCKRWSKATKTQQRILSPQAALSTDPLETSWSEPAHVVLAYHEAAAENVELYRYVHVQYIPDEIIDGVQGMSANEISPSEDAVKTREAVSSYSMSWSTMERWLESKWPDLSGFYPVLQSNGQWTFVIPESLTTVSMEMKHNLNTLLIHFHSSNDASFCHTFGRGVTGVFTTLQPE